MRDPIDRLLWEHQGIKRQIADLRGAVLALAEQGDRALAGVRPVLQGTARMIDSELLAHARREDEALFPVIERALNEKALTGEMRQEHRDIHAEADLFRVTLRQLNEVEHPAIVAGGAQLGRLAGADAGAQALRAAGAELIRLLDEHFRKEEEILFPMAREVLDLAELEEISRQMDALDA